jgi:hypothetical protein
MAHEVAATGYSRKEDRGGEDNRMLDFASIKAELDGAGTDLHKIEEIYARVHAEIEIAPTDKRAALEAKFYDLCNEQASRAKQALDAHANAAKAIFERS